MKNISYFFIVSLITFSSYGQLLDTYDISTSPNGIIPMPIGLPSQYDSFVKYTKIQAPNDQAIHFIAQNQITDAQMVRARNILQFYLTNLPGSEYGADKSAVMNAMGDNEAVLMLLNGYDGQADPPNVFGQPLYEEEIAVEGHLWYTSNDYNEHRDASFEEILHLMHDTGIGVDGPGTLPGALPAYQAEIRAAQVNANANNFEIWPIGADGSVPGVQDWYNELANENSLSQEYLAAVIDVYYGLWEPWTESATTGMWGLYIAKTREEIETEDPMGWALLPKYFAPYININMDIDPSFTGVFNMTRTPSEPYTFKSQYLQHTTLTGSNDSGIKGNSLDNQLNGNDSDNTLEGLVGEDILNGKAGNDIALFTGASTEYTITFNSDHVVVADNVANRDHTDLVYNCEILRFTDQDIEVVLGQNDIDFENSIQMAPNPCLDSVSFRINNVTSDTITIQLFDLQGRKVSESSHNQQNITMDTSALSSGMYIVQLQAGDHVANKRLSVK